MKPSLYRAIIGVSFTLIILTGCGAPVPATPIPAPITPTTTPIPPTETSAPPAATLTPRNTTAPGTKFEVTTGGLKIELEVHACNMSLVGYGLFTTEGIFDDDVRSMMDFTMEIFNPDQPDVGPLPGDDVMCWMKGEVYEGTITNSQLKTWVDDDTVYLVDQSGIQSDLIFADVIPDEQDFLLLFSTKRDYAPAQIQLPDVLVDFP